MGDGRSVVGRWAGTLRAVVDRVGPVRFLAHAGNITGSAAQGAEEFVRAVEAFHSARVKSGEFLRRNKACRSEQRQGTERHHFGGGFSNQVGEGEWFERWKKTVVTNVAEKNGPLEGNASGAWSFDSGVRRDDDQFPSTTLLIP